MVVLAKHPVAGAVKTRLARAVGPAAACALYRAFVRDLARRLARTGLVVWWAVTPAGAPLGRLVGSRRVFGQRGRDLGARIHHALRRVRAEGSGAAIALGADAPHVPERELRRAVRALARGVDVVLGPARDGGYYLIGVRTPVRALFADIPWSTPRVLAATRRRCDALGLSRLELAPGFDVDEVADLVALRRVVRARPDELPHTRRALAAVSRRLSRRVESPRPAASPSSGCGRR